MVAPNEPTTPTPSTGPAKFPLGRTVATPAALTALEEAGQDPAELLQRHQSGDFGDVSASDRAANEAAVEQGERVFSAYLLTTGTKVWVITEADRSATTLLLPDDY